MAVCDERINASARTGCASVDDPWTEKVRIGFVVAALLLSGSCLPRLGDPALPALLGNSGLIVHGVSAPPTFWPAPGIYSVDQSVTITSVPSGATIYYTTDGSMPGVGTSVYSGPVVVAGNGHSVSLRAIAVSAGMMESAVTVGDYSIDYGRKILPFPSPMNTTVTPSLLAEANQSGQWFTIPTTGTTFSWSDAQTLIIHLSWLQLPENTQLRFTISGLQYADGTAAPDTVETFVTSIASSAPSVADTGQTACYNGTVPQFCNNAFFPRQDGDYTNIPRARSFTGPTAHAIYVSDYTTTDNVTGLVWKTCLLGVDGLFCSVGVTGYFNWYNAINACAPLNSGNGGAGYAGRTNWRLPTILELQTLASFGMYLPAIDSARFPSAQSGGTWSATSHAILSFPDGWVLNFASGAVNSNNQRDTSALPVRCVSGGSSNVRSLSDLGDGTVKDNVTNLLWQKCSAGQNNDSTCSGAPILQSWDVALNYCNGLGLAGRSWRLPSVNEWNSIVDRSRVSPSIDTTYFPGTGTTYWTSTTHFFANSNAWAFALTDGYLNNYTKTTAVYVRCVASLP